MQKLTKDTRLKLVLKTVLVFIVLFFVLLGVQRVSLWFDYNRIVSPKLAIDVESNWFYTEERPVVSPIVQLVNDYPTEVDTPIKQYVCDVFGDQCVIALAVVSCESNWDEDALGVNDPSVGWKYRADAGLFQINSIHWEEAGGLEFVLDPYNNVDVAYDIYQQSGWSAWATVNNGCIWGEL